MPFVLVIRELGSSWAGRGPRATIHATEAEAEAALVDYVRNNWDSEMDGDELPEDEEDMVSQYFENVLEAYDIAQTV
jgi:hypothetical protein